MLNLDFFVHSILAGRYVYLRELRVVIKSTSSVEYVIKEFVRTSYFSSGYQV